MVTASTSSLMLFLALNLITVKVLASNFVAVTSSNGEKLCAVDKPSEVALNVRSAVKCGVICLADIFCEAYGFKEPLEECDLYDCKAPTNYSAVPGCSTYTIQGKFSFITYCTLSRSI